MAVLEELDLSVHEGRLELLEYRDLEDLQGPSAYLAQQELKDSLELQVFLDLMDGLVPLDLLDLLDLKDVKDHLESLDSMDGPVPLVPQDLKELLELKVFQDLKDLKDPLESQSLDPVVPKELKDSLDLKDPWDLHLLLELLALLVPKDLVELPDLMVLMEIME